MNKVIGLDVGNANTKVSIGDGIKSPKVRVKPSIVTEVPSGMPGALKLVSGSAEWAGRIWIVGDSAGGSYPMDADFCGLGKPRLGLALLLSTIWADIQDGDRLSVAVSIHNRAIAQDMRNALGGVQVAESFGKNACRKSITIDVVQVTSEAAGTMHVEGSVGRNCLIDLGGGTVGVLSSIGCKLDTQSSPYFADNLGFRFMVAEFCKHPLVESACVPYAMRFDEARSFLENYSVNKGFFEPRHGGCHNLGQAIEEEAQKWVDRAWVEVNRAASVQIQSASTVYVTGGALMLPQVRAAVEAKGLKPVKWPIDGNCRGLYSFAAKKALAGV